MTIIFTAAARVVPLTALLLMTGRLVTGVGAKLEVATDRWVMYRLQVAAELDEGDGS
jgi:hypothetical protein